MRWDPQQYTRYAEERSRPLQDLIARIRVERPEHVLDLGCGPGPMTRSLADRWPQASVLGIDSSEDMIAKAADHAVPGTVEFRVADVTSFTPDHTYDVIVSNALLQWVPDHLDLFPRFASWLRPGGAVAIQVPDNFTDPSHVLLRELRQSPSWRDRLAEDADRSAGVQRPAAYLDALAAVGLEPDVWQSTYLHVLSGENAVLEWMKGTALRPVLARLSGDADATAAFLAELAQLLERAYPVRPNGRTVFPFTRTFAVGHATMEA
jgi:trans-aconitate 2-methyltransferase